MYHAANQALAQFGIGTKENVNCWVVHQQIKYTQIRHLLQELSGQGKLSLQKTVQGITRAKWINIYELNDFTLCLSV